MNFSNENKFHSVLKIGVFRRSTGRGTKKCIPYLSIPPPMSYVSWLVPLRGSLKCSTHTTKRNLELSNQDYPRLNVHSAVTKISGNTSPPNPSFSLCYKFSDYFPNTFYLYKCTSMMLHMGILPIAGMHNWKPFRAKLAEQ